MWDVICERLDSREDVAGIDTKSAQMLNDLRHD